MKPTLILALLALTSACATCREHPGHCAVAAGMVVGLVVISAATNGSPAHHDVSIQPVTCAGGSCK